MTDEKTLIIPGRYGDTVLQYAQQVADGTIPANEDRVLCCKRFIRMASSGEYEMRPRDADLVISLIEACFKHRKGQTLEGKPLRGEPFLMEPWQKFCIYGMLLFFFPGTRERVVKEAFIFIPRKNGKTILVAAMAWVS